MDKDYVANRQYKDKLFCFLFGKKEYAENILSLYNALNGTDYKDSGDIEITTISDAVYITMKNDVSILIDSYLSLWEQQSSYNPNMPIRGFMYFGKMYDSYITGRNLNIYGRKLVKLPTPKYIVFYNGNEERAATEKLYLSDAFIQEDCEKGFQWTATMINLNKGKNDELLEKCKALSDYMFLVELIRTFQKEMEFTDAVNRAVTECIEKDVLADFLRKHKAEVLDMCITEFNEKAFADGIHQEGVEEGREIGKEETVLSFLNKGLITIEAAAEELGITLEELQEKMKLKKNT